MTNAKPVSGRLATGIAVASTALLLSACTATGGGSIPSNEPTQKATFGFAFDALSATMSGSFHDPSGTVTVNGVERTVDVRFRGTGKRRSCRPSDPECPQGPPAKGGCIVSEPAYQSQNPRFPGSGLVFLYVCDVDGDRASADDDSIFLQVDSGPFEGYTNAGNPSGNITVKG